MSVELLLLRERIHLDRRRLQEAQEARMDAAFDREIKIMERDLSTYTGARLRFFKHLQEEIMKNTFLMNKCGYFY